MTYRLANITNAKIKNNKTGNILFANIEHFESTRTGEMKFSGNCLETGKKATWKASNCSIVELEGFNIDVRVK